MKKTAFLISILVIMGVHINVNAQTTTTSIFMDCQLTIFVSPPEGGTTFPPPPSFIIMGCQPLDIEAFPNPGYTFSHWEGDTQGSDNPIMLSGWNEAITAVFLPNFCEGLADYDQDVDGSDASIFKSHFGRSLFKNPCPPNGPAPVPKTGQTTCYDNSGILVDCATTGHDGENQRGVTWPNPRFTDNGNGTITDNLTGLIWLKNANCFGMRTWNDALSDANGLKDGACGLSDGSDSGDWRLPSRFELESLLDMDNYDHALPSGHPFTDPQYFFYWSSTTNASDTLNAWGVAMGTGVVDRGRKNVHEFFIWPVRGGH